MFEQDRVLLRLQQRVLAEPAVIVCFLSGSFGRGAQDQFSDLDVTLVYTDEKSRQRAYENRRAFVRSVLPFVPAKSFDATQLGPFLHVALYSNGCKVDYRYETQETLAPNLWDREIRILKDSSGWAEAHKSSSLALGASIPRPTTTARELNELDERFWVMFMDVYRQVRRGDFDRPFPIYLQLLNSTLPPMLDLLPNSDSARNSLIEASYQRDPRPTLEHLRRLVRAYLAARDAIVAQHQLVFNADRALERELLRKIGP